MDSYDRHRAAEAQFRQLLTDNGLPQPDWVEDGPAGVTFFFEAQKTAIVVDFDCPVCEPPVLH